MRFIHFKGYIECMAEVARFAKRKGLPAVKLVADVVWCRLRYGCLLEQFMDGSFYLRKSFERRKMVTAPLWNHLLETVNAKDSIHILQNKVDFNRFFHEFIGREWLYSKDMTKDQLQELLKRHGGEAMVKPLADKQGNGIHLLRLEDKDISQAFDELKAQDVLIEERVKQHPDMVFDAQAVNTLRVFTVYDNATRKAYVIKASVRVGVGGAIVDNSHAGGIAYEVDREYGYIVSTGWRRGLSGVKVHPGTDIFMLGRKIPHWQAVKQLVVTAAEKLPQIRIIGWDVAIKQDGPLLIEGNHVPDLDLLEYVGSFGYRDEILQHLKN